MAKRYGLAYTSSIFRRGVKMVWETVVGLEVHVQLSTHSKLFSGASAAFGAEPNCHTSAIDIAFPGVLPVLNKAAVDKAIRFGLAIHATIDRASQFARKNYFYPDLPKGYQISQHDRPIISNGTLPFYLNGEVKQVHIERAHLEEDAGKSVHDLFDYESGIDLNRAGTPLLEIVTGPDLRSAQEAVAYAKALHRLVVWLGICDGNMQEGSFRMDANVSIRRLGEPLGTRCEIKNLNSFRFLESAIEYEVSRQIECIEDGKKVIQQTRLYDPEHHETRAMRSKENAHDYRYFPDPDLPTLRISEEWISSIKKDMPILPDDIIRDLTHTYGLSNSDAQVVVQSKEHVDYFNEVMRIIKEPKMIVNWMGSELAAYLNREQLSISNSAIDPIRFGKMIERLKDATLSSKTAKQVFELLSKSSDDVDVLIDLNGLRQVQDLSILQSWIDDAIASSPKMVEEFRAGKEKALNALVGRVMKSSQGRANPEQVQKILKEMLSL
jgi:aspartyl-tRNA(Asn)/glutamyl-tRNA(Gln) amidotransferase subunit B